MKSCYFCQNGITYVDYKNRQILKNFINTQGKILPPKRTGACTTHQRELAQAVKRARVMAMLPFTNK